MKGKVLILDRVHSLFLEQLPQMEFEVVEAYDATADEINWSDYQGLVLRSRMPINAKVLDQCINLSFIARVGAGLENIDINKAVSKGIEVLSAPEGNRNAVAEHALGMLLALFNRLLLADSEVRRGLWLREENRGLELRGKTIGIIGYGNTGSALARKLSGMDCRVLAYDKYRQGFSNSYAEESNWEEIQAEADILSLHLPQSEETHYLLDDQLIAGFKKSFFLINTARGNIVKTEALIRGLESGKVLGACLDVLEFEKSSFEDIYQKGTNSNLEYLLESNKVILSPHIAGWTHESKLRMAEILLSKIKKHSL